MSKSSRAPLFGLLLLMLGLVAVSAVTTQVLAWHFAYQPALGAPMVGRLYPPWAWLEWQYVYYDRAPSLFNIAYVAFLAAVGACFLIYVVVVGASRRSRRHEGVHGTAHWATPAEVRQAGLLPEDGKPGAGVYVGGWTDPKGQLRYLRDNGPSHVCAIAPTRSGKGVGLVLPTLLSWPHSVVCHDIKGELWHFTAGWRQAHAGNVVLKFDPAAAEGSCAFNPLEEVRVGTAHEIGDVQNLVTIVVDPDGKGLADHWAKTAHALLTGVILHLLYQRRDGRPGMADVAMALSDPSRPVDQLYQEMLDNRHGGTTQQVVAAAARDMKNRPDNERGSVLSTAMSYLSLYRDPLVAGTSSRSDFRIAVLMDHDRPVSLYLVVRPADKDRLKPLMRLILNQIVRVLVRDDLGVKDGQPVSPHRHRLLLMMDEFPSFGKREVFQEALAFIAGYGIKAYLVIQDMAQLTGAYGRDESITSNCHIRIAYAPNKVETAKWLSDMTGTQTVIKEEISTSGARFGAVLGHVSRSYRETSRPLMTPDECMRLKSPVKDGEGKIIEPGDMLIFAAGHAPIQGTQPLYFRDPVFSQRARIVAPADTDRLRAAAPAKAFVL